MSKRFLVTLSLHSSLLFTSPFCLPLSLCFCPSLSVSISLSLSLSVSICLYLSLSVSICLYLSLSVSVCLYLSLSVSICPYLSLSVSNFYLFLSVSICFSLSLSVSICLFLSLSVSICLSMSLYIAIIYDYRSWTYEAYFLDICRVARAFIQLGLQPHRTVAIIGELTASSRRRVNHSCPMRCLGFPSFHSCVRKASKFDHLIIFLVHMVFREVPIS